MTKPGVGGDDARLGGRVPLGHLEERTIIRIAAMGLPPRAVCILIAGGGGSGSGAGAGRSGGGSDEGEAALMCLMLVRMSAMPFEKVE
eukprot:CAMPEP_0174702158 /NCGR_PEP_ID=MMETSP1094-20130205/6536_1 /TAXON_ID=156173 /ORGANISM="Chrysochromulina brevifilum, Strain UTEX LB 985" /LENGTH=87 /DNA_ID=CAMNT_0015899897 /DNA_START=298 /DNA_END=562 /DNA_ORIENTATION=+